jgi:hypothetical protein
VFYVFFVLRYYYVRNLHSTNHIALVEIMETGSIAVLANPFTAEGLKLKIVILTC